jgi:hypothetical protein
MFTVFLQFHRNHVFTTTKNDCIVNTGKQGNCGWVGLWILALCAKSIHGLTLPQCLRRPVPLPAEEACRHVVGGHNHAIFEPKKHKLFMVGEPVPDQNSPMETNIIPDNNKPGLL